MSLLLVLGSCIPDQKTITVGPESQTLPCLTLIEVLLRLRADLISLGLIPRGLPRFIFCDVWARTPPAMPPAGKADGSQILFCTNWNLVLGIWDFNASWACPEDSLLYLCFLKEMNF